MTTYTPEVSMVPLFYDCPRGCKGSAPSGRFVLSEAWPLWRARAGDGVSDTIVDAVMVTCPKCETPMYARNWPIGSENQHLAKQDE